ncbi:SUR7/PalI family-domain-containing protein [Fomes fomentarius]|nr:SUR7/PalI family-domain-containing protein [Fomes fomentarius]
MGLLRPATPGFLVTLIATILLAVVSFNVPVLKSMYFLKATVNNNNAHIEVTLGTLGYCLETNNNQTCSKPAVGYELDVNGLLGNKLPIEIPQVLVKWITYALVLHIVALLLSGISAVFGLLAHVREMSMTYCSTCVSGFAASVALLAFVFDIVLFFLTKSRINAIDGGHAEIGMSLWLTLAAWVLLFFAGCFYGLGRCCIRRRPRGPDREIGRSAPDNNYADQVRLDAIKAEADRKARQAAGKNEIGLPAFQEHERQPLTSKADEHETYVEDGDHIVAYHPETMSSGAGVGAGVAAYNRQQQPQYAGGYTQGAPGSRSVDAYYNNSAPHPSYPTPARQGSQHTQAPSVYNDPYALPAGAAPAAAGAAAGYLSTTPYSHQQQPSGASYGHPARGTSYHSAVSHQDPYQQNYQQDYRNMADPFAAQPSQTTFNPDAYNASSYMYNAQAQSPPPNGGSNTNPYRGTQTYQPDRAYTLGGGGYGDNVVPALDPSYPQYGNRSPAPTASVYTTSSTTPSVAPPPINTNTRVASPPGMPQPTSPRGPRNPTASIPAPVVESPVEDYSDSPPMYDAATAQPPGRWGAKQ